MNTKMKIGIFASVMLIVSLAAVALSGTYYVGDTGARLAALELDGDLNAMGNTITNASFDEISKTNAQNSSKNGIYITDFGAIPNDGISDSDAIEAAINSVDGGTIFFPIGNTSISRPIKIKRGITLAGMTTADPSKSGSQIVLMDHSNCDLVQTPSGASGSSSDATHYMAIRNLAFNGNMWNQDTENMGIKFWGTYVTSHIDNIMIKNVKGVALSLQFSPDLKIGQVWITRVNTSTAAVEINKNYSEIGGYVYFEDLWVEAVLETSSTSAYSLKANQRGTAIYSRNLRNLHIANLHSEYTGDTIVLNNTKVIQIDHLKTHNTGTNDSKTGVINLADGNVYIVSIGPAYLQSPTTNFTLVSKKSSYNWTNITETSIAKNTDGSQYYPGYHSKYDNMTFAYILPETEIRGTLDMVGHRIINTSSIATLTTQGMVMCLNFNNDSILLNETFDCSTSNSKYMVNGTPEYLVTGGVGNSGAYRFDGQNDQLKASSTISLYNYTIMFWINFSDLSRNQDIIGDNNANKNFIRYDSSNAKFRIRVDDTSYVYMQPTPTIQKNKIYHLTFTNDGITSTLYVNGLNVNHTNGLTKLNINRIGNAYSDGTSNRRLNGTLDNIIVFNRVLSNDEIGNYYHRKIEVNMPFSLIKGGHVYGDFRTWGSFRIGNGNNQKNITLTAPNGNEGCCGMNNSYHWTCSAGACT